MTRAARQGVRCALVVFLLLAVALTSGVWQPAVARADTSECPAHQAALEAIHAKIDEHNSRSRGSGPPEIVIPYNREAQQLEAEQARILDRLRACELAIDKVRAGGPPPKPLPPRILSALGGVAAVSRPGWTAPTAPVTLPDGRVTIPKGHPLRGVWDLLKTGESPMRPYPNVPLQGNARPNIGDKHPSGYTVGTRRSTGVPAVSPDHIVPKVEILYLPRFLELAPENMWEVINAPLNLQWLPSEVNETVKNFRSAAGMKGVDPIWQQQQIQLQDQKRRELTELIAQLADSQLPKS